MCRDNRSLQARDLGFHWDGDCLARKTEVACLMDGELVYYGSSPQSNREAVLVVLVVLTLLVLFLFLLLLEFFTLNSRPFLVVGFVDDDGVDEVDEASGLWMESH